MSITRIQEQKGCSVLESSSMQESSRVESSFARENSSVVAYGFSSVAYQQPGSIQAGYIQLFYSAAHARSALACAAPEVQILITNNQQDISPLNLAAALHKDCALRDIYVQVPEPDEQFMFRAKAAGVRGVVTREEAVRLLALAGAFFEDAALSGLGEPTPPKEHAALCLGCPGVLGSAGVLKNASCDLLEGIAGATAGEHAPEDAQEALEELSEGAAANSTVLESAVFGNTRTPPFETSDDMAWLEYVLELDEIEGLGSVQGAAVLEKSPSLQTEAGVERPPGQERGVLLAALPDSSDKGVVATFVSGRGGVGKSSLTVLCAMELWRTGIRVAMLDMDLQFGDLSILVGNEPQSNIQRLNIEQLCNKNAALFTLEDSLLLVEAPTNPELAEELVYQIPQVLAQLRKAADIVLVNTSCLWNESLAALACSTDKLVICMDQRATSVAAARQVVELCVRLQIPSTRIEYLLNRCARNAPLSDIDASLAMGGAEIISITDGGADVDELLSLGCPLELLSSYTALRQSIQVLAEHLLQKPGCGQDRRSAQK